MKVKCFSYEEIGRDAMRKTLEEISSLPVKEFSDFVTAIWPQHGLNDLETVSDMKDLYKKIIKFAAYKYDNSSDNMDIDFAVDTRMVKFGSISPNISLLLFYSKDPKNTKYIGGAGFILRITDNICDDLKNRLLSDKNLVSTGFSF